MAAHVHQATPISSCTSLVILEFHTAHGLGSELEMVAGINQQFDDKCEGYSIQMINSRIMKI